MSSSNKSFNVLSVIQSISKELHVQGLAQSIRYKVLQVFDTIFSLCDVYSEQGSNNGDHNTAYANETQTHDVYKLMIFYELQPHINSIVLPCFLEIIEGEKDPRCLLLMLNVLYLVLKYNLLNY